MKKILYVIVLSVCLLTACASDNAEENVNPTGSARPPMATASVDVPEPTGTPVPTEASAPTDAPEREIVASVPTYTIFAESRYFAALREDGTVAVLGEPLRPEDSERVEKWKDIVSLCKSDIPAALTKDGRIVVSATDSYEKELERYLESFSDDYSPNAYEIISNLEYLRDASGIVWAELQYPVSCLSLDRDGVLIDTELGDSSPVIKDPFMAEAGRYVYLDCYGTVRSVEDGEPVEKTNGHGPFVSITGMYVRTDGTLWTDSYIEAFHNWTGIASVCSEGGMVVGLRKDGTVVAHTSGPGEKAYGNYAVETWRDVVEVTTNGYYTVGRTSDGRLLCTEIPPEAGVSFTKEDVEGLLLK